MKQIFLSAVCTVFLASVVCYSQNRLSAESLRYAGAFRLPDYTPYEHGWYWGGTALTYYPDGDASGTQDGYPGSLFGTGHAWNMFVSEISIPSPVVSAGKDISELPRAQTLQPFTDVRQNLFVDGSGNELFYEIIRAGIAYLPAQGTQTTGKLHMAWGQHYQEEQQDPSHMWFETDLSNPQPSGPWYCGGYTNYVTCDYLFEIPRAWADQYAPGYRLATGRFRDGLWGGRGPAVLAMQPRQTESPAEGDTVRNVIPLMLYGTQESGVQHLHIEGHMRMNGFKEADEWVGGAWVTSDAGSALLLAGTKGVGECWYGLPDGTVWEEPYPQDPLNQRGWWCAEFSARIYFFDSGHLGQVTQGQMEPWQVQPYDSLDISQYLFAVQSGQQKHQLGSVCYDRQRNRLFVAEFLADEDKPIIHVWDIKQETGVHKQRSPEPSDMQLLGNYPNPFNSSTVIVFDSKSAGMVSVTVCDVNGRIFLKKNQFVSKPGKHSISLSMADMPSGTYVYTLNTEGRYETKKMILLR